MSSCEQEMPQFEDEKLKLQPGLWHKITEDDAKRYDATLDEWVLVVGITPGYHPRNLHGAGVLVSTVTGRSSIETVQGVIGKFPLEDVVRKASDWTEAYLCTAAPRYRRPKAKKPPAARKPRVPKKVPPVDVSADWANPPKLPDDAFPDYAKMDFEQEYPATPSGADYDSKKYDLEYDLEKKKSDLEKALDDFGREVEKPLPKPTPKPKPVPEVKTRPQVTKADGTPFKYAHAMLADVVALRKCGVNPYLLGPAGSGKSHIGFQVSEVFGVVCGVVPLTNDLSRSAFFGYPDYKGDLVRTEFRNRWEHGGVFVLDEVDNGAPSILASINGGLAAGIMAFPDGMIPMHPDFHLIATANTGGHGPTRQYVARQPLDAATLDRFVEVKVDYDEALERDLAAKEHPEGEAWAVMVQTWRKRAADNGYEDVLITPRSSIEGAKMLHSFTQAEVAEMRVFKGMNAAKAAVILGDTMKVTV